MRRSRPPPKDEDAELGAVGSGVKGGRPSHRFPLFGISPGEIAVYLTFFALSFGVSISFLLSARTSPGEDDGMSTLGYPVANPASCGTDEEVVLNVFKWAVSKGVYVHSNLSTGLFPVPGDTSGATVRGIRAKGSIRKNDVLFRVPEGLLINIGTVRSDPFWRDKYRDVNSMQDGVGGLAMWMLREAMNETSDWRPYMCSLPRHVALPILYTQRKLGRVRGELPEAQRPMLVPMLQAQRDAFEVKFLSLVPALVRRYPGDFSARDYTFERYVWAASMIMSRSWGRDVTITEANATHNRTNRTVHTLAPAADMPNHSDEGLQAAKTKDGSLVLRAWRRLEEGEQVEISYGQKCDAEVLSTYGFIPFNNSHVPCKASSQPPSEEKMKNMTTWRRKWRGHFAAVIRGLEKKADEERNSMNTTTRKAPPLLSV